MDCAMELQLCGSFQVSDICLSVRPSVALSLSLSVVSISQYLHTYIRLWWLNQQKLDVSRSMFHFSNSGCCHSCSGGCVVMWWLCCCVVMCVAAESHRSAVFQVTSAATVFFPPGSSIDQPGSVLVSPRTQEHFCFTFFCVLLQYWLSTFISQWLNTLDSKEIYSQVLDHLPDLQLLTSDNFEVCRK